MTSAPPLNQLCDLLEELLSVESDNYPMGFWHYTSFQCGMTGAALLRAERTTKEIRAYKQKARDILRQLEAREANIKVECLLDAVELCNRLANKELDYAKMHREENDIAASLNSLHTAQGAKACSNLLLDEAKACLTKTTLLADETVAPGESVSVEKKSDPLDGNYDY